MPIAPMTVDRIAFRLDKWKRQLIDLTRRNRLLNYRATSASTVEVVDEYPQLVFEQLMSGDVFTFDPHPDEEDEADEEETDDDDQVGDGGEAADINHDAEEEPDAPAKKDLRTGRDLSEAIGGRVADRHRDTHLQTRLPAERLGKNLLNIYRRAERSMEEQGINTLFLALGMLEWTEGRGSDVRSKAPLLMVPVTLSRDTAASPFQLSLGDEEPFINLALVEKLRIDFKIELPAVPEFTEELDVEEVFREVRKAVSEFADWRLTADVTLGLFSFQKFIMYRDIERNEERLKAHPLIQAICQEGETKEETVMGLPSDIAHADLDDEMSPLDTVQVMDADSSQQRAMLAVRRGHDLVIEGPPGTGKSQTIANVIADSLHQGKTVLFVSEKMAALEVVQDRLEHHADLGSYVLELHSNKASKTEFVEEISRSLNDWDQPNTDDGGELRRLQKLTGDLKTYVRDLHQPDDTLGLSPFQGVGRLAALKDTPRLAVELDGIEEVDGEALAAARELVEELARTMEAVRDPLSHPLRGLGLEFTGRSEQDALEERVANAGEAFEELVDALFELTEHLGLRSPETLGEAGVLVEGSRVLARSPGAEVSILENPRWNELSAQTTELLASGKRYQENRARIKSRLSLDVLDTDLTEPLTHYQNALHQGVLRWVLPGYWKARSTLRSFLLPSYSPESAQTLATDIGHAMACRSELEEIRAGDDLGSELFGSRWNGPGSDWEELQAFSQWVVEFRHYALKELLAERGMDLAAKGQVEGHDTGERIRRADQAITRCRATLTTLLEVGQFGTESGLEPNAGTPLADLGRRIAEVEGSLHELRDYSTFVAARNACEDNALTSPLVEAALAEDIEPDRIPDAFERRFFELWTESTIRRRPALTRFRTGKHERKIEEFRERDRASKDLAKDRVRAGLAQRRQDLLGSKLRPQLQTLQREAKKRRNILPVRRLMRRTPEALQRVKPCFMMSPLSVAQFLDADSIHFDLLVFDEASQIPPADAIGAIIRADQTVVVGDSKQLPPTNFFGMHLDDADLAEEEELELLVDLESILDEVTVSGTPRLRLKWHYRSEHESLIRFSNEEFYEDDPLYVFPTAFSEHDSLGLHFELVADAFYEGRGRNTGEAMRVVDAVVEHIKNLPDLSLGVGTFGISQQTLILDLLDERRREDPSIEWFFQQEGERKFFVKNLENIQGDDRDVIFLSVTYGPDENKVLRRNFGPINKQGGWRRLNVLTTRAKKRLKIFSTMTGDQINVDGIAEGAALLRQYLIFAETGNYPSSNLGLGPPDSPFEREVIRALEGRGYRTVPQVGDSGYRIDIGVLDPECAGRYLCGIECDGATYHSAATVRDRDRLRQQVLEDRGWDIHRIWSTDWFHSPKTEIDRLVSLIEESRRRDLEAPSPPKRQPTGPTKETGATSRPDPEPEPEPARTPLDEIPVASYRRFKVERPQASEAFYTAPVHRVADLIADVVALEGPVHFDEIARRVAEAWGMERTGRRIKSRVTKACNLLESAEAVESRRGFYWIQGLEAFPVRRRNGDDVNADIELIALDEILAGLRLLLSHRSPLLPDEVVTETARVFGFARTGSKLRERIEEATEILIDQGEVRIGGTGLHLNQER